MCDPSSQAQKWICEYCTYENFPSSIKCTMCNGAKPLLNEDIFRLSPLEVTMGGSDTDYAVCGATAEDAEASSLFAAPINTNEYASNLRNPAQHTHELPSSTMQSDKWACKSCTYLNWPRSMRCVQCCSSRSPSKIMDMERNSASQMNLEVTGAESTALNAPARKSLLENNSLNLHETFENLRIKPARENEPHMINITERADNGASSNRLSPTQYASAAVQNNTINSAQLQQQQKSCIIKWVCHTCTYENWPKSLKCSMCGKAKDSTAVSNNMATAAAENSTTSIVCASNKSQTETHEENNAVLSNNSLNKKKKNLYQLGSSETINCDTIQERQERRQRQIRRQIDRQWLNACLGVVDNNYGAVEAYLSCGGDPARSLTGPEIALLNRNSAFDVGHTLVHLAIRFHREEMLPLLLAQISGSGPGIKRVPSYVAPDLAADIRRHFANTLRLRKSLMNCYYVQEHATFSLPSEIEELPIPIQEQLYEELLDRDAQKQLENPPPALNWSIEITARLGSRLLVLWNRSAGDCLLDSAMQATWGVFDRDNILRRALADSLNQCAVIFYPRWKEYEMFQASMLNFTLEEAQWEGDWNNLLTLASQPGSSLEQLHIFALAHILRRPIIVYGVKYVKSFRGEDIGFARFEGVYLPIFWDQNFCIKSPIALGYTRGHFSALVPMEPYASIDARRDETGVTYLPLMDCESKLLPIHFLTPAEMGNEETIMRQWLDVRVTDGGLLVAEQKLRKRPLLVAQMLEEWLNHYRRVAQVISAPFARRAQQIGFSSDGDTDEE